MYDIMDEAKRIVDVNAGTCDDECMNTYRAAALLHVVASAARHGRFASCIMFLCDRPKFFGAPLRDLAVKVATLLLHRTKDHLWALKWSVFGTSLDFWLKLRAFFLAVCVDELPSVRDVAAEMVSVARAHRHCVKSLAADVAINPWVLLVFSTHGPGMGQLMSQVAQLWRDWRSLDTVSSIHVRKFCIARGIMLHPYANINTRHDPTVYVTIDAGLERLAEDRTTSCDFYADVLLAGIGIATKNTETTLPERIGQRIAMLRTCQQFCPSAAALWANVMARSPPCSDESPDCSTPEHAQCVGQVLSKLSIHARVHNFSRRTVVLIGGAVHSLLKQRAPASAGVFDKSIIQTIRQHTAYELAQVPKDIFHALEMHQAEQFIQSAPWAAAVMADAGTETGAGTVTPKMVCGGGLPWPAGPVTFAAFAVPQKDVRPVLRRAVREAWNLRSYFDVDEVLEAIDDVLNFVLAAEEMRDYVRRHIIAAAAVGF